MAETQSEDRLDSPEAVRKKVLTFLEARRLAGEKWTAQDIAQELDIPLEIAQIAVLNAISRNIKVEIPDVSDLYRGAFLAGDSDIFPFDGIKAVGNGFYAVVVFGVTIATLPFIKAYELWQHFHPAETKDVPGDDPSNDDANKGKIKGETDHAEQRRQQARKGDASREVGDRNRVVREGQHLKDADTGYDVYVNGDRVVIVDSKTGKQVTQFKNTRKNTLQRIRSGRWIPNP